jgi:hypothetical protein
MEGTLLRRILLLLVKFSLVSGVIAGIAEAQNMTDFGAATAGAVVGGASGKSVSDGLTAIFGKVDQQTVKAAGKETSTKSDGAKSDRDTAVKKDAPALTVSPGVARDVDTGVPPPPPVRPIARQEPTLPVAANFVTPPPFAPSTMADALPLAPIPPPPTMTPESLKQVSVGMSRADVLKLGDPSSRIAMFEGGHMVETFSYRAEGQRFGIVRLQDGAVAKIDGQ